MTTHEQPQIRWISLHTEQPPDEQFVLLTGPSGTTATPMFIMVGRRHERYRPGRWLDVSNTPLSDSGLDPTHWAPLPNAPTSTIDANSWYRHVYQGYLVMVLRTGKFGTSGEVAVMYVRDDEPRDNETLILPQHEFLNLFKRVA